MMEHGRGIAPLTGATHGSTERAARWLAGSILSFDLNVETRRLLEEEGWRTAGRNAKTLVKEADLRLVLVALRQGMALDPHQASGPITIQTLSGKLRVGLPDQHINLVPGQFIAVEAATRHSVTAIEDATFLLTVAWPGRPSTSPSPSDDGGRSSPAS